MTEGGSTLIVGQARSGLLNTLIPSSSDVDGCLNPCHKIKVLGCIIADEKHNCFPLAAFLHPVENCLGQAAGPVLVEEQSAGD